MRALLYQVIGVVLLVKEGVGHVAVLQLTRFLGRPTARRRMEMAKDGGTWCEASAAGLGL